MIAFIKQSLINNAGNLDTLKCKYFIRFLESEKGFEKYHTIKTFNGKAWKFFSYRDTVMAENLTFLLNEAFKNKKVIISIATSHMTKNVELAYQQDESVKGFKNIISCLDTSIIKKSYFLPFIRYEGRRGRPGSAYELDTAIVPASKNSIEYLLSNKYNYCFLDCKKNNDFKNYLESKIISPTFNDNYKLNWFSMYDGLFFIKEMKPVEISAMFDRTEKSF